VGAGPLAAGVRVVHAHHHRVGDLAGAGRSAITAHIADDHRAGTDPGLGAVVLADPNAADSQATASRTPGVNQHGDHRGGRDAAVGFPTGRFNPCRELRDFGHRPPPPGTNPLLGSRNSSVSSHVGWNIGLAGCAGDVSPDPEQVIIDEPS